MEKKFRLPKEFAIKWLEALRSGKYIQSSGMLSKLIHLEPISNNELENNGFCCLGVAGHICGNPISSLKNAFLYTSSELINIPNEIIKDSETSLESFPFIYVLANLNDGITSSNDELFDGLIIRPDVTIKMEENLKSNRIFNFSFSEIADLIEDNVEFYEVDENNQK